MLDIAQILGVSKASVSLWARDVPFEARPRARARRRGPNALQRRKAVDIERRWQDGLARVGELSERDLFIAGIALYAGEGAKTDGAVKFANSDPRLIRVFCAWLRACFEIDESRLRAWLYLHEGLDLEAAIRYWSEVTSIPPQQFGKPYRAKPDEGIRAVKHVHGCLAVGYSCSATHRTILGMIDGVVGARAGCWPADKFRAIPG